MPPDDVASAYDEWAASYDSDRNKTRDLDAEVVRALPVEMLLGDVLELGCGTGKNTVWLAEHARSVLALDFSEGMLSVAHDRVRSERAHFQRHDIREGLPREPASFDFVTADLVLEHLETLGPLFAEVARVLRPGGRFHVSELHPYRQLLGVQARYESAGDQAVLVTSYVHTVSEFLNAALAAGLVLEDVRELSRADDVPERGPRLLSLIWRR